MLVPDETEEQWLVAMHFPPTATGAVVFQALPNPTEQRALEDGVMLPFVNLAAMGT